MTGSGDYTFSSISLQPICSQYNGIHLFFFVLECLQNTFIAIAKSFPCLMMHGCLDLIVWRASK